MVEVLQATYIQNLKCDRSFFYKKERMTEQVCNDDAQKA